MDQSREQFEAYYADKFGATLQWVIDRRSDGKDFVGYQMGIGIQQAWEMWKASRKQLVVELPMRQAIYASGYGQGYMVDSVAGDALNYESVIEALEKAGVKHDG